MNEIQFCVMMITALGVGFITPPLGLNLFVVSGLTGESILRKLLLRHPICLLYDDRRSVDCIRAGNFHNYAS